MNNLFSKMDFKNSAKYLIYSLIFLPFFKLIVSIISIKLPVYYGPTAFFTAMALIKMPYSYKSWICVNAVSLLYTGLAFITDSSLSAAKFKIQLAGLIYFNTLYVLYRYFKHEKEHWNQYKDQLLKMTINLGLFMMILCLVSFVINFYNHPMPVSLEQALEYLSFDRASPFFRLEILGRFNPTGLFVGDIDNHRYIGQQLLILPLIGFVFAYERFLNDKTYCKSLLGYFFLLLICILATNSRGFALAVVMTIGLYTIRHCSFKLNALYVVGICLAPLLLFTLSDKVLSGRGCQFSVVKDHVSFIGNGIGAFVDQLNDRCQPTLKVKQYNNIIATSYDNVHVEFVHYFGIILYLLAVGFAARYFISHNDYRHRLAFFIAFVFLSLNFNLFEFSILPIFLILILPKNQHN